MIRNNENEQNSFDKHIRELFQNAEIRPSADLFEKIQQDLPAKKRTINLIYLVAASLIVFLSVGVIIKMQIDSHPTQILAHAVKQPFAHPKGPGASPLNNDKLLSKSSLLHKSVDNIEKQSTDDKQPAFAKKQRSNRSSLSNNNTVVKSMVENNHITEKTVVSNNPAKKQEPVNNFSDHSSTMQKTVLSSSSKKDTLQNNHIISENRENIPNASRVAIASSSDLKKSWDTDIHPSIVNGSEIAKDAIQFSNKSNQAALDNARSTRKKKGIFSNLLGSVKKKLTNISNEFVTEKTDQTTIQIGFIAISKYK